MRAGGRAVREEARSRSAAQIEAIVDEAAQAMAPWLLAGEAAPKAAHARLRDLRKALAEAAKTQQEAAAFSDALLARVEDWNTAHPGEEVAAPGPVVVVEARPPAWTEASLEDLRTARAFRAGFEAAYGSLSASPDDPAVVAGLVLASAMFDSACLQARDLALFADWLAQPDGAIVDAPDLPPWVDLKYRAPGPRKGGKPRPLRKVSGSDCAGDYALRRLFLAPRTLDLIALHDRLGGAPLALTAAAGNGAKLQNFLRAACGVGARPGLRRLLRGAMVLLQARRDGPDHTMALLAGRRMESFAATSESWNILLQGGPTGTEEQARPMTAPDLVAGPPQAHAREARPVPEHRAYAQLHNALSDRRLTRGDMTSPDRKLTEGALIRLLTELPWDATTPSCLRLLRDWYLHLLEAEGDAVGSIRRYHSTLALALCDMAGAVALEDCDPDQLEDLYTLILETDARSPLEQVRLRQRLSALHRFAMEHAAWNFPEIDESLLQGEGGVTRINATLLGRSTINRARDILRTESGLPPDVARAADAVMLVMSRAGLRIGEATKALYGHFEDTRQTGIDPAEAVVFVRPSIFGNNKTPGAYRQIKPLRAMTPGERADFLDYLSHRRGFSAQGPLFGVVQPDGSVAPFDSRSLGAVISDCLRRVSGLAEASSHGLRRAAANNLFLTLLEAHTGSSRLDPFLTRMTGWTREERADIAEAVAPANRPRDTWQAMARQLGHGAPGTSFEAYITVADLAVFEACAMGAEDIEHAKLRLAELPKRHVQLAGEVLAPAGGESRQAIVGTVASPALAMYEALTRIDDGDPVERAARITYLPVAFLEDRVSPAQDWAALTTNRKTSAQLRLQPMERAGKLTPAPLDSAAKLAEALSIADALVALAKQQPDAVQSWLRFTLHDATTGNAGTRLRTPADLGRWCAVAIRLRPPERWQVDRVDPVGVSKDQMLAWVGARPEGTKAKRTQSQTARSIAVRVRLLRPDTAGTEKGRPTGSWAGCTRFAAHLASIYLRVETTSTENSPITAEKLNEGGY